MLLPHGAIIALIDGEKLELFRNTGNEADPSLQPMDAPRLDEHNTGSGGRHYSSSGNPAESRLGEDAHVAGVARWLNEQVLGHKIKHLVVIADPRSLGEMRRHYHKQTEQVLLGELAKDLAGKKGPDIIAALRGK